MLLDTQVLAWDEVGDSQLGMGKSVWLGSVYVFGPDDLTVIALLVNAGADTSDAYRIALESGLSEEIVGLLR